MANLLFLFSLIMIWTMLLYHMFLMQGGFWHYMTFRNPIPEWSKNMKNLPKVSVLIPAHNEAVVVAATLRAMSRIN
ncbi:glycosyltransferase, partial [Brevibacillus sp. SIMBA_076]